MAGLATERWDRDRQGSMDMGETEKLPGELVTARDLGGEGEKKGSGGRAKCQGSETWMSE